MAWLKKNKPHKNAEGRVALTIQEHGIDTVIDVGANMGQTHDTLRRWGFKGNIISIEPLPSLQENLQKKAKQDPLWTVLPPLALGNDNKNIEMNVSEATDMSSILEVSDELLVALPKSNKVTQVTIPMKTLDTLYEELQLDQKRVFIKLDTQGYEMNILKHGKKALQKAIGLRLEMSLFEVYKGEALMSEIMMFMKENNFAPYLIWETYFSRKLNRQLQADGVFYKERKTA
ncbi:MAG: FkbM family methyltransferase [Alphaproteobacteria bacterium]|nr:FkbM family methyltransferase [Alphaproteobacteria bacterium]